jgi:hypothetical protein
VIVVPVHKPKWFVSANHGKLRLSSLFSSSVQAFMIIELVLMVPRSTGLDSNFSGAVAQLGERLICIQEVAGSIPTSSTTLSCSGLGGQRSDAAA